MELHSALDDFKRSQGDPHRFAGERRSTTGRFSGLDDRLVHVAPDGAVRDYSYPLTGLAGIERSRLGLVDDGGCEWFENGDQQYVPDTAVVETVHDCGEYACRQFDLTIDRLHLTHVVLESARDALDRVPRLRVCVGFAPEGRATRVGQLRHGDAVEIYHDREHDFLAASTALSVTEQVPERFGELLSPEPIAFPRSSSKDRYEEGRLSPVVNATVPLTGSQPSATVGTVLADTAPPSETAVRTDSNHGGTHRTDALDRLRSEVTDHDSREAIVTAGRQQARALVDGASTDIDRAFVDLRSLGLLRTASGGRIAGPDFDPFYHYSGGYGYTWFRDDGEIARFLLEADSETGLGLDAWHAKSVDFHCETQRPDGTWPHRVWPHNGRLAPGWANGRLEAGKTDDYQADQTASVAAFLATYLRWVDPDDDRVREALVEAADGMDETLAADGLPERVQNAWENMTGRFTHTAATYLDAYAAIARGPVGDDLTARAHDRARTVFDALDDLWVPDRGIYALRLDDGDLDPRVDGSTLALASAHREYDAIATVDETRLDRLVSHVETTLAELYRDPDGPVAGLARFEGDPWRTSTQADEKIWTVTTAWGAYASAQFASLLADHDRPAAQAFEQRAGELLELVAPDGSLRQPGGYLPEQFFDDGTPDSATPLGWPHAIRLATASVLSDSGGSAAAEHTESSASAVDRSQPSNE